VALLGSSYRPLGEQSGMYQIMARLVDKCTRAWNLHVDLGQTFCHADGMSAEKLSVLHV
jgi:hypothetical protein